ncbi:hypothetical protein K445DRAFT_234447 [Daldinia sp. EC12]|nr:hypothetical protein K445DRAFT_234447 [Daldinia sp. EC12]
MNRIVNVTGVDKQQRAPSEGIALKAGVAMIGSFSYSVPAWPDLILYRHIQHPGILCMSCTVLIVVLGNAPNTPKMKYHLFCLFRGGCLAPGFTLHPME